jgi:hypothetical protein
MSSLSRDDVAKLAGLARIEMSEEELINLSNEFTVILDAVARVQEVAGANVEYRLYNYADFYPIAKSVTNSNGITGITTGLGDLLIWASVGNEYAWQKVSIETIDTLTLTIKSMYPDFYTEKLDLTPPILRDVETGSEAGRQTNSRRLAEEDSIRNAYMKTFPDSTAIADWAKLWQYAPDSARYLMQSSFGNYQEIRSFLESIKPELRSLALGFLYTLSAKDLRDTRKFILNDHFTNALAFYTPEWQKNRQMEFFLSERKKGANRQLQ